MLLQRRHRKPEQGGHLGIGPAITMLQQDGHPLPFGKALQTTGETGLDKVIQFVGNGGEYSEASATRLPCLVSANPPQESRWVVHRPDPVPVLPRIGPGLRCGLHALVPSECGHQGPPQSGIGPLHKQRECVQKSLIGVKRIGRHLTNNAQSPPGL